jgi:RHS repeat-associated protein
MVCDEKGMMLEKNNEDVFGLRGEGCGLSKYGLSSNMLDSTTGLYYFAARCYDPKVGRFLEMDPVLSEGGMMNMYDYCGNNPGNVVDRYGESWFENMFGVTWDEFKKYGYDKEIKDKYNKDEKAALSSNDKSNLTVDITAAVGDASLGAATIASAPLKAVTFCGLGIFIQIMVYSSDASTIYNSNFDQKEKEYLVDRLFYKKIIGNTVGAVLGGLAGSAAATAITANSGGTGTGSYGYLIPMGSIFGGMVGEDTTESIYDYFH